MKRRWKRDGVGVACATVCAWRAARGERRNASKAQPICQSFFCTNLFQRSSSGASLGTCRPGSQITVSCSTAAASCQQFVSVCILRGHEKHCRVDTLGTCRARHSEHPPRVPQILSRPLAHHAAHGNVLGNEVAFGTHVIQCESFFSTIIWRSQHTGRDSWDWVGPPAWERACFNSPEWVGGSSPVKTEPPQIVLLLLFWSLLRMCVYSHHPTHATEQTANFRTCKPGDVGKHNPGN